MYLSPTRKAALAAYDQFITSFQAKYPKATECLEKDKEWLFTLYDFPAQHWSYPRTTNPIESTFATVGSAPNEPKDAARASLPSPWSSNSVPRPNNIGAD
jgi:putative transposase